MLKIKLVQLILSNLKLNNSQIKMEHDPTSNNSTSSCNAFESELAWCVQRLKTSLNSASITEKKGKYSN